MVIFLFTVTFSKWASATDLLCVSTTRSNGQLTSLYGSVDLNQTLVLTVPHNGQTTQYNVVISNIKNHPNLEAIEIVGYVKDLFFIGGGQMNVQLLYSTDSRSASLLRTQRPGLNLVNKIEEIALICDLQQHKVPPAMTSAATFK